jgi:GTP-binding protein
MIDEIEQVAVRSRAPLLLMGPTGAGKSQLARRIYELKRVKRQVKGPLVEVNCATLKGDSAMSALFGHRKGAFTGAAADRAGLLRTADTGVLFLDEIGELGLDEQAMILRAIEDKRFLPVGADREVDSDFQLIAGTTRDTIHTRYQAFGLDCFLVDTAGLRKKAKVHENIEFYSTIRTIKAVESCDVALLLLDAQQGMEKQDLAILHLADKHKKGLVILVNKWDLVDAKDKKIKDWEEMIYKSIAPLSGVPIMFVSATEKQRVIKAMEKAVEVFHEMRKHIPTHKLNEVMQEVVARYQPPVVKGKSVKIKFVTQIRGSHPTFIFFCTHPQYVKENYKRYLENQLREHFGFDGCPLSVWFRQK